MLDHAMKWDAVPEWDSVRLSGRSVDIRTIDLAEQHLVSGNLLAFAQASGLDPHGAGALGVVDGETYSIRLARDRVLAVGSLNVGITLGWNTAGFAVTEIGSGYHVFELTGEGIPDLLARATTIDLSAPGPCAAIGFAGVPAILYCHRHAGPNGVRLHLERGLAASLWLWFAAVLDR